MTAVLDITQKHLRLDTGRGREGVQWDNVKRWLWSVWGSVSGQGAHRHSLAVSPGPEALVIRRGKAACRQGQAVWTVLPMCSWSSSRFLVSFKFCVEELLGIYSMSAFLLFFLSIIVIIEDIFIVTIMVYKMLLNSLTNIVGALYVCFIKNTVVFKILRHGTWNSSSHSYYLVHSETGLVDE